MAPGTNAGLYSLDGPAGGPEAPGWRCPPHVRLCGHLRKPKSLRRRSFALRADPPRLECYESEKQFRASGARGAPPRRSLSLAGACTTGKRAGARRRPLIVLHTRDGGLPWTTEGGLALDAASEDQQHVWYSAMLQLRNRNAAAAASGASSPEEAGPPAPSFQEVWPVTLRPRGPGQSRGALVGGGYRLCLGNGALTLVKKAGRGGDPRAVASAGRAPGAAGPGGGPAPPAALVLPLLSVRRCGHSDAFFFLELGRSAPTGPGELWLQAPDAVVARGIHETVLDAMKRLGGGAAPTKPPPLRAPGPPPHEGASPEDGGTRASGSYMAMGRGADYVPMGPGEAGGYMVMAPPGGSPLSPSSPDYVNTGGSPRPHAPFPSCSLPRSFRVGGPGPGDAPEGEYVAIGLPTSDYVPWPRGGGTDPQPRSRPGTPASITLT
ncbi:LOW QUALITY PROTEIN: insulin receptor substrate 1-like, partial [Ornithorhynchus anatinus]|uniref:LOW QUALITY PROTEIN: insulin receptor substrate 1-like n=1 Tax=Ornithorhynchus anatinus TaxID=9258 RepID=UPI0019D45AB7